MHPLPERVLQFGTGILLRGLPDFFIDKANRQNIFNGSVVVVKSTAGEAADLSDGFQTLVRGMENGREVREDITNTAISRVLPAAERWSEILSVAASPEISVIVSNTTEAGLSLVLEPVDRHPPVSFPAKLTAVLLERFRKLGERAPLLLVIPTELIPDNANLLQSMVYELISFNRTDYAFRLWLDGHVLFCNSLVDRIVTRPSAAEISREPQRNTAAIQTEPYRLWAIEGGEEVKRILSFSQCDAGVVVSPDIRYYRERKLRLLNGTHTIMVCLGFVKGYNTVYECMRDPALRQFAEEVMKQEILPTLTLGSAEQNLAFADAVLDRFGNPFSEHLLLNITLQATLKMKMRIIPSLLSQPTVPRRMAEGFAAYLLFMKTIKKENGIWYGKRGDVLYPVRDDAAEYFQHVWKAADLKEIVMIVCRNAELWGHDLSVVPGFEGSVTEHLTQLHSSW